MLQKLMQKIALLSLYQLKVNSKSWKENNYVVNNLKLGGIEMKKFNIEEMENYEVNEIKDDLVMLESQFEGSGYGNVLAKAFHYINYLEEKLVNIANNEERAIKILIENGYVVKKLTVGQLKDAKECEECGFEGDCSFCRCSICVVQ